MSADVKIGNGPQRPKADGFPVAPLIEAVMEVQFVGGLSADDVEQVKSDLTQWYPSVTENKQTEFMYDVGAETLNVDDARSFYRLEAMDDTDIALVRPNGFAVSQLAPYKSWDTLFARFDRDWRNIEERCGPRSAARLGIRSINRIDVPLVDGVARYEDYFAGYVRLPDSLPNVSDFYFRVSFDIPSIGAVALVQSAVLAPAVEGKASFALDIDLGTTNGLADNRKDLLQQFSAFREHKNRIYRQFLTEQALGEFS